MSKVGRDIMDQLDIIDSTVGAIDDVVTLMLGDTAGSTLPGSAVLHKLHATLRSELDELAVMNGLNKCLTTSG